VSTYKPLHGDAIRAVSDGEPECVITWIKRPQGGIRMFATRDVRDTGWGQRTTDREEVVWHLDANMAHVLTVDRQTPAEALQWVLQRWAREDAEERDAIERERLRASGALGAVERKGIER
jgi:hypothetical protein